MKNHCVSRMKAEAESVILTYILTLHDVICGQLETEDKAQADDMKPPSFKGEAEMKQGWGRILLTNQNWNGAIWCNQIAFIAHKKDMRNKIGMVQFDAIKLRLLHTKKK